MGEKPRFGDIVENGWASVDNPTRTGFFVRQGCRTGRMNAGPYVEVTDGHGKFWELPMDKGHRVTFRPAADALSQRDARIAELEAHLTFIGRVARSDGDRTFDRCIMDLGYIDDRCRTSRLSGQDGEG